MKKLLSCILIGAMLVSSMCTFSTFAYGSKSSYTKPRTVATTASNNHKSKETSTKAKSQKPASKSFWSNESLVEGVKGAASIIIVGGGLAGISAIASTLLDFPLVPVVTGIAAVTGVSASVVCLSGVAMAITGANPFRLFMNIATANHVVSFAHHTLEVVRLAQDIYNRPKK
ncbi:MAG: hypothetical protein RUMPE_00239 [Eubacteriales bacterium SKADARSKE-1]|nr:hypothetical protein [Eubacteriales bacterium SKADARSKE-1]